MTEEELAEIEAAFWRCEPLSNGHHWGLIAEVRSLMSRLSHAESELEYLKSQQQPSKTCFGPHLLLDLSGCLNSAVSSVEYIAAFLSDLPDQIGMTKIAPPYAFRYSGKVPEDWGVTGVTIIAESHLSIHTFPNRNRFLTADIYSCKDFDHTKVLRLFQEAFKPSSMQHSLIWRGKNFR